jgi:hypothetical protein
VRLGLTERGLDGQRTLPAGHYDPYALLDIADGRRLGESTGVWGSVLRAALVRTAMREVDACEPTQPC